MLLNASAFIFLLGVLPTICFAAEQHILKDAKSGTKRNPFDAEFAKLVKEALDEWHVPGVAVGVVDGDDVFTEGYGIATFPSTPVTPSTLFYTGSTTKAFTAAAMSLLIDNSSQYNNIAWNTAISSIIRDDFVLEDEYATKRVTIEDALSHRTGMPRHDLSYGGKYGVDAHEGTVRDVVRSLRFLPMAAEMRTKWMYCNMMFMTIGYVIEQLTGVWLGDFLKEHIWRPLGMHSTYFSLQDALKAPEHLAQGYTYVYGEKEYRAVPFGNLTIEHGAGGVVSNVLDYSKWIQAHLKQSSPISAAGFKALQTPQFLTGPLMGGGEGPSPYTGPSAYTLGWSVKTYHGVEIFEHGGGMEGYGTQVTYIPSLQFGVVAIANTPVTSNNVATEMAMTLVDDKIGVPGKQRYNWREEQQRAFKHALAAYHNALARFYPTIPSPTMPLSLPLKDYTGTYFNPGYRNLTITLSPTNSSQLFVDHSHVTFGMKMDIQHVSGEYFLAWLDSTAAAESVYVSAAPAEFRVGSGGVVEAFGIALDEVLGRKIWFERI